MYKSLTLIPFLLLGGNVLAAPQATNPGRCTRDACLQVAAQSGRQDCPNVLATTVTPATSFATVTTTQTRTIGTTQTLTATQVNTATTTLNVVTTAVATTTVTSTSTEVDTVTVTVTLTGMKKRDAAITAPIAARADSTVPAYATGACGNNYQRFSSACRCAGASTNTVTAPVPTATRTVTNTVNINRTIRTRSTLTVTGATTTQTQTATITTVTTSTTTVTVTATENSTSTATTLTTATTGTTTTTSVTTETTTTATPSPTPFILQADGGDYDDQYAFLSGDDGATLHFDGDASNANTFTIDNMSHLQSIGLYADTLNAPDSAPYTVFFDTADNINSTGLVYLTCAAGPNTGDMGFAVLNCDFRNGPAVFQTCTGIPDMDPDTVLSAPLLPTIFHALDDVGWYGSAAFLALAVSSAPWGKAFMYLDFKSVYLASIAFFLLGSIVGGVAPTNIAIVVGRTIQGFGIAGTMNGSIIVINYVSHPRRHPVLIGV
ncbi:Major facilitator superfamily transporter [Apiospora rasikravindrae]|uniref:Major facilitator superfamily transporter n=1 Tax=Apiospora rasikravindrae TaxID=990691 RepID=A0ABR1TBZ6_9PEZI